VERERQERERTEDNGGIYKFNIYIYIFKLNYHYYIYISNIYYYLYK